MTTKADYLRKSDMLSYNKYLCRTEDGEELIMIWYTWFFSDGNTPARRLFHPDDCELNMEGREIAFPIEKRDELP